MLKRSFLSVLAGVVIFILFALIVEKLRAEECKVYAEGTSVRKHVSVDAVVSNDHPPVPHQVIGFHNLSVYYEEVNGAQVMKIAKRPEFTFVPQATDRGVSK
jgi:hypothetical protein